MSYIQRFISSFLVAIILLSSITPVMAQQTTLTYDNRGNLISNGTECFEYNGRNLPSLVKTCATEQLIEKYEYRPDGQRFKVERYHDGVHIETIYNFDDFIEVKVDEATGQDETSYHVYANGVLVGKVLPDGGKHFYHTDHLESVVLITDESGNPVENRTLYGPFGNLVIAAQTISAYGYTGQEFDSTGFNWYNSRTYDPQVGMFAQPDSIRPSVRPTDLNPYAYVQNKPLKHTDPSGNCIDGLTTLACIAAVWAVVETAGDIHSLASSTSQLIENPSFESLTSFGIDLATVADVGGGIEIALRATEAVAFDDGQSLGGLALTAGLQTVTSRNIGEKTSAKIKAFGPADEIWTKTRFDGKDVWISNKMGPEVIDPNSGLTNKERLGSGLNPVTSDGQPTDFHHTTQTEEGPIAIIPRLFHQKNSAILHSNTGHESSKINRPIFRKWKDSFKSWWSKSQNE